ncbi:MAG: hypothetical protein IKF49_05130 [Clostridia bacterium]|nr:hypothetical protein [Clostridia bacterium]
MENKVLLNTCLLVASGIVKIKIFYYNIFVVLYPDLKCRSYEWLEDEDDFFIDLWQNIYEYGESRGTYESYNDDEWLNILDNITAWTVEPE